MLQQCKNTLFIALAFLLSTAFAGADEGREAYEVVVKPYQESRVPIPIKRYQSETLVIRPQAGYQLKKSEITLQNDLILWSMVSSSPHEDRYRLVNPFSSTEFVHIDGELKPLGKPGNVGTPPLDPPFHITVPAVDLDWIGPGAPADEDQEDTSFVWVGDQPIQKFVVRCPDESKDDMFRWNTSADKRPDMQLIWDDTKIDIVDLSDPSAPLRTSPYKISKRIWDNPDIILEFQVTRKDDAIPNGEDIPIQLERCSLPGDTNNETTFDEIKCKILAIDLDIDTVPRWGDEYYTTDIRAPENDSNEETQGEWIGKVVFVNNIDKDGDEVPDYMDGWDCPLSQIPKLEREEEGSRASNSAERFVPIALEIQPSLVSDEDIRICFDYPASPLGSMKRIVEMWNISAGDKKKGSSSLESKTAPAEIVKSSVGKIRIWKKDGLEPRFASNDFVESGKSYRLPDLGCDSRKENLFYVEGINASENWGDIPICVKFSIDGGKSWIAEDCVHITCIMSNLGICVVRQFYIQAKPGTRKIITPNYSTPYVFLHNLFFHTTTTESAKKQILIR